MTKIPTNKHILSESKGTKRNVRKCSCEIEITTKS